METLSIIGITVFSGLLCFKQDLHQTWIFCVNLVFSIYIALFVAPVIAGLIPEFSPGVDFCKLPATMFFLTVILITALYKLTDTVSLKAHDQYSLPTHVSKIGSMFFGGLSGAVLIAFLCACVCMMPLSETITDINREPIVKASKTTLKLAIKTLDFFSMQSMSCEAESVLNNITPYKTDK